MLPPIDDDIIKQHLNIVVCNCKVCYFDKQICSSRIKTIIRQLEYQIETIKDEETIEWKKEILNIIKQNDANSFTNLFVEMQLLAEKCLYFLASENNMCNDKFIKFINDYSNKFSKREILLSLYNENSKLNKYNIVYNNLFSDRIEFNWQKTNTDFSIINTFYINR